MPPDSFLATESPRGAMKSKYYLMAAGFLVVAAAIGLEVLLRIAYGAGDPLLLRADPDIGYLFRANQTVHRRENGLHINAFHQRSPNVNQVPPEGTHRVLVIGDSVTFGGTYVDQSETITARLDELLSDSQILNASVPSWGIGNEAAYIARFGTLCSDLVIWQIGSHDLHQAKSSGHKIGKSPFYPAEKPWTAIGETWQRFIWPRVIRLGSRKWFDPEKADSATAVSSDEIRKSFERNLQIFSKGVATVRTSGSRVMVLFTPDRREVTGASGAPWKEDLYPQLQQRFFAEAQALDVPVMNLLESWAGTRDAGRFYRDGVHFSARGNLAVAKALKGWIKTHGASVSITNAGSDSYEQACKAAAG